MRHKRMLAPINSIKHFVPNSKAIIVTDTVLNHVVIEAVAQNNVTATKDVVEGSVIKAVHVEMWIVPISTSVFTQFVLIIHKVPGGQTLPDNTNMLNLQNYENKKNILYTTQGVMGISPGTTLPLHRNWVIIPKGKQRFGFGDRLVVSVYNLGANIEACGMHIYKEYK